MRLVEVLTSDQRTRYVVLDDQGNLVIPLARYLKHLDQRGYAPNTLRSYGLSLRYLDITCLTYVGSQPGHKNSIFSVVVVPDGAFPGAAFIVQ